MTARNYDVTLNFGTENIFSTIGKFESGNVVIGTTSGSTGIIANVDATANTLKVKLSNSLNEFAVGENVHSNIADARVLNVEFTYSNANATVAVVDEVNYAALYPKLEEARFALRTAGNTFTESIANALILPVNANSKNEITVLARSIQVHPDEYIWTGDLSTSANQHASFGGSLKLNSQTTFNVVPMFGNAIVFKYNSLTVDNVYTVRVATANLKSSTFEPSVYTGNTITAVSNTILSITNSPYIAEKNAFTQNPIVRLVEIYYPGEWYPPNANDNPTAQGAGLSWPNDFPFRIAEINGDVISDINYNVTYDGGSYSPYPINISAIDQQSDGEINEVTVNIFNFENTMSALVENPFLVGNNKNNSAMAIVNGEYVNGIDPRTINYNPNQISNWPTFPIYETSSKTTANLAANILHNLRTVTSAYNYDSTAVGTYGKENAAWSRDDVKSIDGAALANWDEKKLDTRDLLGAVVVIKSTFANFLDYWPEYSTIRSIYGNAYEMITTMPYRVGDNVKSNRGSTEATIEGIEENRFLFLSNDLYTGTATGDPVYIVNVDADPEAYLEDVFKIDSLDSLNDTVATFTLSSWLQYFKFVLPKRKFYKNSCQWAYKGEECQYPGPGGGIIPGTSNTAPTEGFAADNSEVAVALDICGKSLRSCTIRHNQVHFGGFPATGRTIPRQ